LQDRAVGPADGNILPVRGGGGDGLLSAARNPVDFAERGGASGPGIHAEGAGLGPGLGARLAEELTRRTPPGRVLSCPFPPALKLELFPPLRRHFEDKTVRAPVSGEVREDLHGLQRVISSMGASRTRLGAICPAVRRI
jgi:hypothetical protein